MLILFFALLYLGYSCLIGAWKIENCPAEQHCCCKVKIAEKSWMTSCMNDNYCNKMNGTCGASGNCYVGTSQEDTCTGETSCCCSYKYDGPARVCTSSELCSNLKGSCG